MRETPIFSLEQAARLAQVHIGNASASSSSGRGGAAANRSSAGDLYDDGNYDAYNNLRSNIGRAQGEVQAEAAVGGDTLVYRGGATGRSVCWRRIGIDAEVGDDDEDQTDQKKEEGVELPEQDTVGLVFVDPTGRHVLCIGANNADLYYINIAAEGASSSGKRKPRLLSKLRGIGITSVGWCPIDAAETDLQPSSSSSSGGATNTGTILLGTCTGQIIALAIDAKDKRHDPAPHELVCQTADAGEPITSLHQRWPTPSSAMIIAATPTRLYIFVSTREGGQPGGADASEQHASGTSSVLATAAENLAQCVELPGNIGRSELRFFGGGTATNDAGGKSEMIAWLAGPGIYHATLKLVPAPNSSNHLADRQLLQYADLLVGNTDVPARDGHSHTGPASSQVAMATPGDQGGGCGEAPLSMTLTQYHFLLLYPMRLLAVNRHSGKVVQEIGLANFRLTTTPAAILTDTTMRASYIVGQSSATSSVRLLLIETFDESRDMWRVHLDKKQFDKALQFSKGNHEQENTVLDAQAESCFQSHDYERAAIIWGRLVSSKTNKGNTSFEERALRFVEKNCPDALTTYLLTTLDHIPKRDRSQQTMLATWITELYLDKLNRAQTKVLSSTSISMTPASPAATTTAAAPSGTGTGADVVDDLQYDAVLEDFRSFLKRYSGVLDIKTTKKLLGGGGRTSELVYYCEIIGEWEMVVDYHLGVRDAEKVLGILRRIGVDDAAGQPLPGHADAGHAAELHYRYAGALMELDAIGIVDAWIAMGTRLEPRMLAPTLMLYGADPSGAHLRSSPGQPVESGEPGPGPGRSTSTTPASDSARREEARREAIRYLEFCVYRLKIRDTAVHNLLLSLYVQGSNAIQQQQQQQQRRGRADGSAPTSAREESDTAPAREQGESPGLEEEEPLGGCTDAHLDLSDGGSEQQDQQPHEESSLLNYLNTFAGVSPTETLYDVRYALRLCLINGKRRSVVFILCLLGMYEEAIEVALGGCAGTGGSTGVAVPRDLRLARVVADKAEDDSMRKKLWLRLARDVISDSSDVGTKTNSEKIRRAIAFIKDTDGLLKIEDILPFFPDFILIDDFKEAICEALEDYNTDINDLTRDMDEATRGAELIRRDILRLADRHLEIDARETRCESCLLPIMLPPPSVVASAHGLGLGRAVGGQAFYGFPCGMVFHSECLAKEVARLSSERQRRRLRQLQAEAQQDFDASTCGLADSGPSGGSAGAAVAGGPMSARSDGDAQLSEFFGTSAPGGLGDVHAGAPAPGGSGAVGHVASMLASGESLAAISSSSLLGDSSSVMKDHAQDGAAGALSAQGRGDTSSSTEKTAGPPESSSSATHRMELHEMLCSECPFCSDMIIRTISMPLVDRDRDGIDLAGVSDLEEMEALKL